MSRRVVRSAHAKFRVQRSWVLDPRPPDGSLCSCDPCRIFRRTCFVCFHGRTRGLTKATRSQSRGAYPYPILIILRCICGSRISLLLQWARMSPRACPSSPSSLQQGGFTIDSACGLFGARAALIALFGLNVTPFFFASAGSWIVPDGPLLFGLAIAALAAARLFFQDPVDEALAWRLWLLVGVGLGLAGLSKYSAALTGCGLAAFVVLSPKQRHWLKDPAPYVSAIVAFALVTPVLLWNAAEPLGVVRVSRGARRPKRRSCDPLSLSPWCSGELAFLSPWIFAPLVAGIASRPPSLSGRTASVSALPQPACNRSFQLDAALGRPRPTSLDDAGLVFCLPIDGRLGRQNSACRGALFAARLSFRRRCSP